MLVERVSIRMLITTCLAATTLVGLTGCFGIDGGAEALSAKFAGIESVSIDSPTSVTVHWTTLEAYSNYKVFISTSETPVAESIFDSARVTGLRPGTNYSFSVSGVKSDGSEDGSGKQITSRTWNYFPGITSARIDSFESLRLFWSDVYGPTYNVYYKINERPDMTQLRGTPNSSTQSANGANIDGLAPNTTYYFTVVARYADGTSSLDQFSTTQEIATARVTESHLLTLPTIITPAAAISSIPPTFTITNAPPTYTISFYKNTVSDANLLIEKTGSGTATSTQALPDGLNTILIKIHDTIGGNWAYAVIDNVTSTTAPANAIASLAVTTPTSLTPIPDVRPAALFNIGAYPSFTVNNALPTYETQIWYGDQMIGSGVGNATITTLSSTPLPRGYITVNPKTIYQGQYAILPEISFWNLNISSTPYSAPTSLNGGNAGAGALGSSIAIGDFNCDGRKDLAIGGPLAPFNQMPSSGEVTYSNGAVIVYYANTNGTGLNLTSPLIIPAPNTAKNASSYGQFYGTALAAGNINNDSVATKACDDLIVTAPGDQSDDYKQNQGAIYTYFGSPGGLQVTEYIYNNITCTQAGSYICSTGKYALTNPPDMLMDAENTSRRLGMGTSIAIGNLNDDAYPDVVVGFPEWTDTDTVNNPGYARKNDGAIIIYWGTANGLAPAPIRVTMPAAYQTGSGARMGRALAFGRILDNTQPVQDLIVTIPGLNRGTGVKGGFMVIKGSNDILSKITDGRLTSDYYTAQLDLCTGVTNCGQAVASANVNADDNDDIIFGAPYASLGFTENGGVVVVYGSPAGPYEPAGPYTNNGITCPGANFYIFCYPQVIYRIDAANYWGFGSSITNLGDTNGDGYPEIAIGAPRANHLKNGLTTNAGVAYIYTSGPFGLIPSPARYINLSAPPNSLLGTTVASGKFRSGYGGASYPDLVVTAPGEGSGTNSFGQGIAHIFYNDGTGFPSSISTAQEDARTEGTSAALAGNGFEQARIAGDLNNDGYADLAAPLILPAPHGGLHSLGTTSAASQYGFVVYYGSANGLLTTLAPSYLPVSPTDPLLVTNIGLNDPTFTDTTFAQTILPVADMNGDNFSDLVTMSANKIYLFYGSSNGLVGNPAPKLIPNSLDPLIISNTSYGVTSRSPQLATAGDFNGDGLGDIAFVNSELTSSGSPIVIIYGGMGGPVTAGSLLSPTEAGYGGAVPFNKIGFTPSCDISSGTPICQPTMICAASMALCVGAGTYLGYSGRTNAELSLASVGDIDGDSVDDLVLVDSTTDTYTTNSGSVFILYGGLNLGISPANTVHLTIKPRLVPLTQGNPRQLATVSGGFDINFDGISDFIVGAPRETSADWPTVAIPNPAKYTDGGTAYVIYGIQNGYKANSVCASYPCTVVTDNIANNSPDFVATNIVDNTVSCNSSACNILRFHPSGVNYANWRFGSGVLLLNDISGDGLAEVAVSAHNGGYSDTFVYFGRENGLYTNSVPTTAPACTAGVCTPYLLRITSTDYDIAGWQGSGDINKDGSPDFLISSRFINSPDGKGFWTGGFFLFY